MKIEIVTKNYRVSDELNAILEKKISKLAKFFDGDAKCRVYLKKEKRDSKMEISISHRYMDIRAEGKGENFYDIIDIVVPKLERQIYKHRSKLDDKFKKVAADNQPAFEDENEFALVKTKKFELLPMSIEEAIEQMDLLENKFFVHLNPQDGKINIVYKRYDDTIGLIVPQY